MPNPRDDRLVAVAAPRPDDGSLPAAARSTRWRYAASHLVAVPLVLAAIALSLEYGPLDLAIARSFHDGNLGFAGGQLGWLDRLGHEGARLLPFGVGAGAIAAGLAGYSGLGDFVRHRRVLFTLGVAVVLCALAVNALKPMTTQVCPSKLREFGGTVDYEANRSGPFWAGSSARSGRCLPSAHAGGGYALLGLYFAARASRRRRWAAAGLAIGIAAGLSFSLVRMSQGAHFASATVWSAAVDWTVCALLFMPLLVRRRVDAPARPPPPPRSA